MRHSESKITIIIIKDMHMQTAAVCASVCVCVGLQNGRPLDPLSYAQNQQQTTTRYGKSIHLQSEREGDTERERERGRSAYSARMMMSPSCNVRSQISLNNDC